jgi:flagellar hook-associated protein 1 FlgK
MIASLDTALSIAGGGLAAINQGFAVVSQNVANAQTSGYATEQMTQTTLDAGGQGLGVLTGPTQLLQNQALQSQLNGQNAATGAAQATSSALQPLQTVLGTVGSGDDLGSLLGNVQTSFSALLNDPSSGPQQDAVVNAAQQLTNQINTLSTAYSQAQQSAQTTLSTDVNTLNTALAAIGTISDQIIALQAQGQSTADLQNQRNTQVAAISSLVTAQFVTLPDGDMQVFTTGGAQLPTRGPAPLSVAPTETGPTLYYPGGGLPGIEMGGADISGQLGGGAIGAAMTLRDTTIPTYLGELDEFSQNMASRFQAQGLTLFSDPNGNVPVSTGAPAQSGYLGFSAIITVNPAVAADPSLVRDGTQAIAGSPTGASAFTPNPTGAAGFNTLIERVLNYALGPDVQQGVAQTPGATAGLGPSGTLNAPFGAQATLSDYANAITTSQATDSANATAAATDESQTQSAITTNLQNSVGVNMDSQLSLMVQLQNSYGANAKIISTIQQLYTTLLQAVGG